MNATQDTEFKVLLDEQGIMLSKADVLLLQRQCAEHLARSDLELSALGRKFVEANHPKMVKQFNFEEYYP